MTYNAGVFVSAGQAVLIDPGLFPDEVDRIRAAVYEQDARPHRLVVTHSHWDHLLGPEYFPGVPVVQQAEAVAVLAEFRAAIERQATEWERQSRVERTHPFAMPEPDEVFERETTLTVGDEVLRLIHAPGHAPEHLVVYHAATGLLWAGDMLSDIEIPFVMESLARYRDTLKTLAALDVRMLVPGHGHATASADEIERRFGRDRVYLDDLHERVAFGVQAGRSLAQTLRACEGLSPLQGNDGPHRLNVETAFLELGGRTEAGHEGWSRLQ
jgi:glyoxylase-like metal-dependent hydrolase (beta-lactamase superfamily II)